MCDGFSGWLHKSGKVFFIEPDEDGDISHYDVLLRIPAQFKKDADLVAFEFPDWTVKSFQWDSSNILAWATKKKCVGVFKKVKPIWAEYEKATAAARAEYEKATAAAWDEYEKVKAPAWAEYEKATAAARAEYEKATAPAWAEYEKVKAAAWAEYEKATVAARAEMISKLSTIDGYLK